LKPHSATAWIRIRTQQNVWIRIQPLSWLQKSDQAYKRNRTNEIIKSWLFGYPDVHLRYSPALKAVLRIHDILGWIRIRILGSMPLSNGSGSGFGSGSGSWIRILLVSSLTFKMPAKNKFFNTIFSAYYFLKLHLHHFSKIKSEKE
jgi:hypothetical protein